ncbi:MAG TPA: signal peptidase I, partial [Ilumatobacteraceae bacterium]|nr:signal peptidase I [Ilumatobacteraceae bacterium]
MRYHRILGRAVALLSVATVATSIALSRSSQLLIVTIVTTAMIWGALPQAIDALLGAEESAAPCTGTTAPNGTFTIAVVVRGQAPEVSRITVEAAAAAAPTVVVATHATAVERLGPLPCRIVVAATAEEAINDVAATVDTDALLVLSAGSFADTAAVGAAAGSIRDGAGWVVGRSRAFNRDGFSPLVRGRLGRHLRASARSAGLQLWEPNATIVSSRLLREQPLQPRRPWGSVLRGLGALGFRGEQTDATLSITAEPVDAESYWPSSVVRRRRAVADVADAVITTRGRARWLAGGLLLRELDGLVLAVWLLSPWLLTRSETLAFRCPLWVLTVLVAAPAVLRWVAHRMLHRVRLHPLEDMLAMAYEAPSSVLAVPTAFTRRVRPTRVRLPGEPLVVAGLIFAAFTVFPLLTSGTTARRTAAVGLALTELGFLWLMAMRVIFQRNWVRALYRIHSSMPTRVDGQSATTIDVSPTGIAITGWSQPLPVGSDVGIALTLDDGSTLAARGTVEAWAVRGSRPVAGLSLLVPPADRARWLQQLSRSAADTTHAAAPREHEVRPPSWRTSPVRRWSRRAIVAAIAAVSVSAVAALVLALLGYRPLIVRSASMEPTFGVGDVVVVEDVEVRQLAVGDVATLHDPGSVDDSLTHRVRAISAHGDTVTLTTRGDANADAETFTLPATAVVGRVVTHVAAVGALIAWAGSGG